MIFARSNWKRRQSLRRKSLRYDGPMTSNSIGKSHSNEIEMQEIVKGTHLGSSDEDSLSDVDDENTDDQEIILKNRKSLKFYNLIDGDILIVDSTLTLEVTKPHQHLCNCEFFLTMFCRNRVQSFVECEQDAEDMLKYV